MCDAQLSLLDNRTTDVALFSMQVKSRQSGNFFLKCVVDHPVIHNDLVRKTEEQ
jgi:hypothetical protein